PALRRIYRDIGWRDIIIIIAVCASLERWEATTPPGLFNLFESEAFVEGAISGSCGFEISGHAIGIAPG
ncbi:MAG: hypothetical protein WA376_17715, partial [Terrimicrobiaceae bacterium]